MAVSPMGVTATKAAGYLFKVKGLRCFVYSRDEFCMSRADFALTSSTEDGMFVYPAEAIKALSFLSQGDTTCVMEAAVEDEKHVVKYSTPSGASAERTTFDPELLLTCDDDLSKSVESGELNTSILKEAILAAKPFLPAPKDTTVPDQTKAIEVLSKAKHKSGDGYLYVADGTRAFFFKSEAFEGKDFEIHGLHLPAFLAFAAKCKGNLQVRKGDHFTFATSLDAEGSGPVFGWPKHTKHHEKFAYYSTERDEYGLKVSKARMLNAIHHIRSELDPQKDKIKVTFDGDRSTLQLGVVESNSKVQTTPIPVDLEEGKKTESWTCTINLNYLQDLFSGVKAHQVDFRVIIVPASETRRVPAGMFRTIDTFYLDSSGKAATDPEGNTLCTVTRFTPSKA